MSADWLGLMEPARGESCPTSNVEVPPNKGSMRFHPGIRHPSIPLQLQQPGDQIGDLPGPCRPAGCRKPHSTIRLVIGLGSWSQRAARVAPRDNVEVPPHSESMGFHPGVRNPSIPYNSNNRGTQLEICRVHVAPQGVETLLHQPIADWLGPMEACLLYTSPSPRD